MNNDELYNYFGIKKTASLQQIKKAYRKKSFETHPDQGGSQESFEKCNRYYRILSDPEKRKIYDETGRLDDDKPDLNKHINLFFHYLQTVLQQKINIANTNLVEMIKSKIAEDIANMHKSIDAIPEQRKILRSLKNRFKKTKGDLKNDLIQSFLDQQLVQLDFVRKKNEEHIQTLEKAYDLISEYNYEFEEMLYIKVSSMSFTSDTGTGGF